ncbi:MAG TPA: PepSY-associated TM helix domain-containing protein [Pseudoduganella sp.]|jgi:uncharacterized iron-regulated membrane protein
MTPVTIRRWAWIHKWSSLVCTIFMLLLCITGLPLIYHHEIGHLLGTEVEAKALPAGTPKADMDAIVAAGMAAYPGKKMMYAFQEADEPNLWHLTLGDHGTDENYKATAVDARTAEVLPTPQFEGSFMSVMFHLHVDLYAGLWGKLFLGLMGLLLLVAIVSGVVLYAPFMRKLDFGTVRRARTSRTKWLDLHNLLGIVTLTWLFVVGGTGMINTWADLMYKYWQSTEMADMVAPYKNAAPISRFGSVEASVKRAQAQEPGMKVGFIAFPGTPYTSEHHYGVFMHGDAPLTSRLYKPVLIDAQTTQVTDSRDLPWYLTALLVSQPLHFGDYGGPVLQFLWALLDVLTIIVLGSGLYLWLKRGIAVPARATDEAGAVTASAGVPALARGNTR